MDSIRQHCSELLCLFFFPLESSLVCLFFFLPQPLVVFGCLPHVFWCCHRLIVRLKSEWEEPVQEPLLEGTTQAFFFFFTSLQSGYKIKKKRNKKQKTKKKRRKRDDSIHSRCAAAEVERRWHHWNCEFVTPVLLDHLWFWNQRGRDTRTPISKDELDFDCKPYEK